MDRASATEEVDSGSLPGRVKPKNIKIDAHSFTAWLLAIKKTVWSLQRVWFTGGRSQLDSKTEKPLCCLLAKATWWIKCNYNLQTLKVVYKILSKRKFFLPIIQIGVYIRTFIILFLEKKIGRRLDNFLFHLFLTDFKLLSNVLLSHEYEFAWWINTKSFDNKMFFKQSKTHKK